MKIQLVIALAAFALVFAGCKKDDDDTDNGGNTPEEDYQPVTAGSTWQYHSESLGDYTETATGRDTTFAGDNKKYYIFNTDANGPRFISKNNGEYTQRGYVRELNQDVALLYLKDAPAGTNWTETKEVTQSGFTIPVKVSFTIASRGGSKVVYNKTYENVIAVDIAIAANVFGTELPVATARQFYAKGVGAISSSLNFDFQGTKMTDSMYLVSSDIK
jgi:nitrous oxide reductase accessory protein NosL